MIVFNEEIEPKNTALVCVSHLIARWLHKVASRAVRASREDMRGANQHIQLLFLHLCSESICERRLPAETLEFQIDLLHVRPEPVLAQWSRLLALIDDYNWLVAASLIN
jgi:hypothetical protein